MSSFILMASLLSLLVLLTVLWPLRTRTPGLLVGALIALGVATYALYQWVGTPAALQASTARAAPATLEQAITQLEAELKANPNEPEGWRLLARSYASQGRTADAQAAFERAVQLLPDDANLLVESAQARLYNHPGKKLDAQALARLQHALQIEPQHQRARWFLGVAQRQDGQPAAAANTWESLLPMVDAATANTLLSQINEARAEAGLPALSAPAATHAEAAPAAPVLLRVTIEMAPQMQALLATGDTLFVFARQPNGPPMPVAAKRLPASGFPLTVELGDGDSPMPTLKLSQLDAVDLVARVSKAGDVMAQAGDLEATAVRAQVKAGNHYTLRIEQQRK